MWLQMKDTLVIGGLHGGTSHALLGARYRAVKYYMFQANHIIFFQVQFHQ